MARGKADEGDYELLGYSDVAGFAGVENGQAVVKPLEVSVNKDMAGLPTKFSERIHGERIEVWKRTLPAQRASQMSAVQKHFKEVQKPYDQVTKTMASPSKTYEEPDVEYPSQAKQPAYNYDSRNPAESPLGQMKNHLDQVHSWVKILAIGLIAVACIASTALGGVIFK